ncbi:MAG: hypothetical protein AAGA95_09340 [Pseudomonadota bacterium]
MDQKTRDTMHWIGVLASAIPFFLLSCALLNVWRDPMAWDEGGWVRYGVGLLALEFALLHSGVFLGMLLAGAKRASTQLLLGGVLIGFYGFGVWGLAISVDSPRLVWVFAGVMVGRLITIMTAQFEGAAAVVARSGVGILLYIAGAAGSVFLPIPEWGITDDVVAQVYPDRGEGIWEQHPERAIATAAVYFLLLGLAELFIFGPQKKGGKAKGIEPG